MPRFYLSNMPLMGEIFDLPDNIIRHIHVLRLKHGTEVILFDGKGKSVVAELVKIEKRRILCRIGASIDEDRESSLQITLVQAVSSGDRMDFTLQKGVELGITAFQPVLGERSVVKLSGERADRRVNRWQEIVVAACEQSGRSIIPPVLPLMSFKQYLLHKNNSLHLMMSLRHCTPLRDFVPSPRELVLMAGPEGGWTEEEENIAFAAGCCAFRLGKRVLRTETAALAAVAAMQTLWGDFV